MSFVDWLLSDRPEDKALIGPWGEIVWENRARLVACRR
jgi:hypothetical protein